MNPHEKSLVEQGLARVYRGRVIPVMRGGDENEMIVPALPDDLSAVADDELSGLIETYQTALDDVAAAPHQYVTEERTSDALIEEATAAADGLRAMRAELLSREDPEPPADPADPPADPADPPAEDDPPVDPPAHSELAARLAELAAVPEPVPAAVVAAAPVPAAPPVPRPARDRQPVEAKETRIAMVATAGASDQPLGHEYLNPEEIADTMIRRRSQIGMIPDGVKGEKISIARSSWSNMYSEDRTLGSNEERNRQLVAAATDPDLIRVELDRRIKLQNAGALTASGGLCAPVTPYYQLQMISVPDRPVMSALPAFNADRGGMRYARPAGLSSVTTAVGVRTAAEDGEGGSAAEKTCQVIDCPDFTETDVDIIFHCLQFGNLGARTFPELVAQWNSLVLAAHARLAETTLLTGIDVASTQVTAGALGLGASATLFSQILAAANGMRNRNRMAKNAVLRLLLPWWSVDLIVSDVIRGQFQRFDTDQEKVIALLRSFSIEPSFYIDGADGRGQVFGEQTDGALLPFPESVVWYLYPEGSFIYLDGGVLELGLVRDSVLNRTNDFQIFGESFENVAFVGVESLAVESPVCDSGTVSSPFAVTCPIDYTPAS